MTEQKGGKKKILFVTNTMGRAGAEKCLQALLELLDPEKYDLSVYSIINRGELYDDMPDYVHILNQNPCNKSVLDRAGLAAIARQILWSLVKKCGFITYIPYFFSVLFHQLRIRRLDFSKLFWMLLARNAKRFDEEYDLAVAFIEGAATYYVSRYVKAKKKATYVHIDYLAAGYSPNLDRKYYDRFDRVFCVSDTVRKVFLTAYPDYESKTFFFHNMVPRDRILRLAKEGKGFTDDFDGLRALDNEDPETAHYAAAALMDILQKYSKKLATLSQKYQANPQDADINKEYADVTYEYISSGVLGEIEVKKYSHLYVELIDNLNTFHPDMLDTEQYKNVVDCLLKIGKYDEADKWANLSIERQPNIEQSYLNALNVKYKTEQWDDFKIVLDKMLKSGAQLSQKGIGVVRFWNHR